jgi:hypothetical protein
LIISEPEFLKAEFNHIGKTWTAADLQSDPAKYTSLYSFIESFNSIAFSWREITDRMISEMDILRMGQFPETLQGHFETQTCLKSAAHEFIKVRACYNGKINFLCELEYRFPNTTVQYIKMKPLNYNGVELAGATENLIYAKDGQTQKIALLNCSHNEYVNEKVPLCSKIENMDKCLTKLIHRDFPRQFCIVSLHF